MPSKNVPRPALCGCPALRGVSTWTLFIFMVESKRSSEARVGMKMMEAGRKPRARDGKLLRIISCDTPIFLLTLSFPDTTHTLDLLPLPLLRHGLTTPVPACPQVWGLRWPFWLLTFCGKASSVLTAGTHQSHSCFGGGKQKESKRKETCLCQSPKPLPCPSHARLLDSRVKTSTLSHQGYTLLQHCSKEEENARSSWDSEALPLDANSLSHLFIRPSPFILPISSS